MKPDKKKKGLGKQSKPGDDFYIPNAIMKAGMWPLEKAKPGYFWEMGGAARLIALIVIIGAYMYAALVFPLFIFLFVTGMWVEFGIRDVKGWLRFNLMIGLIVLGISFFLSGPMGWIAAVLAFSAAYSVNESWK